MTHLQFGDQVTVSGLDDEIQSSKVPDRYAKGGLNKSAPGERETSYRFEFRNRVHQSQESVMQFGYALRRLAIKAFPSIPNDCQEQWVLDQFVIGLNNHELKRHV